MLFSKRFRPVASEDQIDKCPSSSCMKKKILQIISGDFMAEGRKSEYG